MTRARVGACAFALAAAMLAAAAVLLALRHHRSCGHGASSMAVRVDHGRTTVIRPAHRTGC